MIVTRLKGGLGNQMFQYALGRRLALERDVPLLLDLTWFAKQKKRKYELYKFNIEADIAAPKLVFRMRKYSKISHVQNTYVLLQNILPIGKRRLIKEQSPVIFNERILRVSKHCFLEGYWQSEKYFAPIKDLLREEFRLKRSLSENHKNLTAIIRKNPNSISVHVRRGDYVSEDTRHWVCDIDYYQRAIDYIAKRIDKPYLYFFSDDIGWVKDHISTDYPVNYIQNSCSDLLDMHLMSSCHHHINANSSFSWWGAWLGEQEDSIIIVPKKWFNKKPFPKDRVPGRWKRL